MQKLLDTNIFAMFIFILIVSANFLAEIFPCKLQHLLRNNMMVKHIFGIFTMAFFVVLSSTNVDKNVFDIAKNTGGLYLLFILIAKCHISILYFIITLLAITFIITILKQQANDKIKNADKQPDVILENNKIIDTYNNTTCFLYISILALTFIGTLAYMGEKKIEYKNDFDYFTFFIGKSKCIEKSPHVNLSKSLEHAFA